MDIRAKEIIGLPVITFGTGRKICGVQDLLVDPERKQVLALFVSEGALFTPARAIPFGRIRAIGPDAVIVPDEKAVIDVRRDPVLKRLNNKQIVRGLRVVTDEGRKLGQVADILLDSRTGEIRGYFVSIGKVLSVTQGQRWLPVESVISAGERVMYVPESMAQEFDQQVGGWAGAIEGAGDKLRTAGAKANTRLLDLGEKAQASGGKLNEQLGQLGDQVRTTVPQRAAEFTVGKTAHQTVAGREGMPIVTQGETITQEHIERARQESKLPQLLMAAGAGPVREHANNLSSEAGDSFSTMRTEARELWDKLTGNYSQSVDQADDRMMQQRIKHALGRPTTRVILDGEDNIILNTGDIITNHAVQAARDAGVLDILVASVYAERPALSLDDLKAPRRGDASLEEVAPVTAGPTPARGRKSSAADAETLPIQQTEAQTTSGRA
jgi:uncharacterized protein YrrD